MNGREWREFVEALKERWGVLWRDRIDDKVRAEGVASKDYDLLFVDRGTVIVATRDYRPPNFRQILKRHAGEKQPDKLAAPNPAIGGWGKFIQEVISKQERFTKRGRPIPSEPETERQQLKKGGRGWLHYARGLLTRG